MTDEEQYRKISIYVSRCEAEGLTSDFMQGGPLRIEVRHDGDCHALKWSISSSVLAEKGYFRRLPVVEDGGAATRFLRVEEIHRIEAENQYVRLHRTGQSHLVRRPYLTMENLAKRLDPHYFSRVHRSHIVNLNYVEGLYSEGTSERAVVLTGGCALPVSSSYWQALQEALLGCELS